ncbi:MAG TPA: DUF2167 domain-containing protein [Bacteroidia bacterium]|jgi:uncharacterized membrane-anchored protein|nr:DUF2167 domain-containing protein [Bacteroidia bacterium]
MKKQLLTLLAFICSLFTYALEGTDSTSIDSTKIRIAAIESTLQYETGTIELESGNAKLTVPAGFRFLGKKQANYVLADLWGNPPDSSVLGLLVPANRGVLDEKSWVFAISFDEMGYVKDDDADDIDYDDLLKEQQKESREANQERIKEGYPPIEFVGWAEKPYYDKNKKVLHWAKELKFGTDSMNTLNYNLRILGRKGIFVINAVATMRELPEVNANLEKVLTSVEFKDGHKYKDFIPDVDNVAAWTIGGLVAGKLLAKAGLFVVLAKFWKLIALGFAGVGSAIVKFFRRKKNKPEEPEQKKDIDENQIA